eukprot:gene18028-biopygen15950
MPAEVSLPASKSLSASFDPYNLLIKSGVPIVVCHQYSNTGLGYHGVHRKRRSKMILRLAGKPHSRRPADGWPTDGRRTAGGWPTDGRRTADGWPTDGRRPADGRPRTPTPCS